MFLRLGRLVSRGTAQICSQRWILGLAVLFMPVVVFSAETYYVTGAYKINGQVLPDIVLQRGETYTFIVAVGAVHPFWIKSVQGVGSENAYNDGLSANGMTTGEMVFTVPNDAPDTLFYNCKNHSTMTGKITVIDAK
jgi:hypothetical protein